MFDLVVLQIVAATFYASLWFLVALRLRRNDVADVAWGAGFIVLALVGRFAVDAISNRGILVLALVTIWGLRLSLQIGLPTMAKLKIRATGSGAKNGEAMPRYERTSRCSCSRVS